MFLSPTPDSQALILAYTPIYLMQPLGIGLIPKTYGASPLYISGTRLICGVYMQPSRPISTAILLASTSFTSSTTFSNLLTSASVDSSLIYLMQPLSKGTKPVVLPQILSIRPTHAVDTQSSSEKLAYRV